MILEKNGQTKVIDDNSSLIHNLKADGWINKSEIKPEQTIESEKPVKTAKKKVK